MFPHHSRCPAVPRNSSVCDVLMRVMCHLSLQSGGPTASGDSDKSKSEVNDEDEEVRESTKPPESSLPALVFPLLVLLCGSQT